MQRALLLSLIAVSYILFAGGPRWTLLPLFLMTVATVLVAPRRTFAFPRDSRALDLFLVALVLALAIQVTPLPRAVASTLSPHAADLRATLRFSSLVGVCPRQ